MRKLLSLTAILLFFAVWVNAQNKEITGKITDSVGNPISGASVRIKGIKKGTSAGIDGAFRLGVPQNATLIFSAVGFEPREVSVGANSTVDIQLLSGGSRVLNEVVVTALGVKREKRSLTYSSQEIKGDVLVGAKQDNIVNGLSGKVSGVQVTNSTGMPGSSARIIIRGATSLIGQNQPLFVVDGVPIDNSEAGAIDAFGQGPQNVSLNQGSTANRAIDIDPNIIESVNVLKGAAATSLYGSAAAAGAIIITTKNGVKSAHPQISISSSYSNSTPLYYPVQDKFAQGSGGVFFDGETQKTSGSWGPAVDTLMVNGQRVKTYNQQKLFFHTGHTTDNNVSVSGANDKSRYLMSYSYLKNDGITPGTDFTRHSFFGKFSSQLGSKVTANFQMNYINSGNDRAAEGNGLANPLWTIFSAPITWNPFPATEPDGSQRLYRSLARNNPYYALDNTGYTELVNRFLPVASLVYNPAPWISVTERIGADIYSDESSYHEADGIINGFFNNNGGVTNRTQAYRQFNNDLIVEMHKDLSPDWFGSFIVGTNLLSQYSHSYTQTGQGGSVANFYNISNFTSVTGGEFLSRYRKTGYYAQANLEYRKFLYLAVTGRYDGSSVLPDKKNFYPYGSAAVGFVFTELMKPDPAALSFGKIRVSYAAVGNDDLAPYSLGTPFTQATGSANNINYPFNGQNAFVIANVLGNSGLQNESLREFETGLELKFMHNRLSFEGSYFDRQTSNLLTPVIVAPSSGYFKYQLNAGSISNKGVELLLSGAAVRGKNFSWDISANFTKINNKVLKLAPGVSSIQVGGFGGGGGIYAFAGKPYGVIFGSTYTTDSATNIVVGDPGSAIPGVPIKGDLAIIGNTNPDFLAGLTNTFTYKGLSLSFLFDWKQHGDIYNLDDHYNWFYGTPKSTENRTPRIVKGVYQTSGKPNATTISAQTYFQAVSDIDEAVVEDGTYIKLRNLTLSYALSQTSLKGSVFKGISINLSGNNLWIYKPHYNGSDPETSLQGSTSQGVVNYLTPTSRTFILGLKLML
jgi:TonB-linked SusC/RagA family outer membrane protein